MDEESAQEVFENLVTSTVHDETPKQTPSPTDLSENQGPSPQNDEQENTEQRSSVEPEPEQKNELPFENDEHQGNENVINLDDNSDVEMEIPDQEVVRASMSMNNQQNRRTNDSTNAIEEIVLDDDDDDMSVDEEATKIFNEERRKMRTDKIDSLLSWFVKMKPELIENCEIFRGDYLTSSVNEKNLMLEIETCKKYLESYKTLGDLDDVVEALSLPSVHHALMGICLAVLELNNSEDIDFGPLCYDRIDLWAYMEISRWLNLPETGVNYVNGPLQLMRKILAPPSFVVLGLTTLWLKENDYPMRLDFMEAESYYCSVEELKEFESLIVKTTQEFWRKNEEVHEDNARVSESITTALRDLDAAEIAIQADINRLMQVKDQLLNYRIEDIQEEIANIEPPETLDSLTDMEREELRMLRESLAEAREIMLRRTQEAAEHRASARSLHEALVLWPGEYCLARADAKDSQSLELARVETQISSVCYRVNFHHSQVSENVDIRDLAYIKLGMFDALVSNTTYVGLRVACLCKESPNSEAMGWFSGTIASRAASNGQEFLVFLDRGDDIYLQAPYNPNTSEAMRISSISTESDDISVIKERISLMKMIPMISQSFKENTELDIVKVYRQLRGERYSARIAFVKRFMEKYPEWPLLRLPVGNVLPIYDENLKRNQKTMVTVVHTDRSFCVVRQQQAVASMGYGCLDYPCVQPGHNHKDESIYRGSYRFPEVYQINGKGTENSHMSKRSLDKMKRQFDPSETAKKMPQKEKYDYGAIDRLNLTTSSENKQKETQMSSSEIAERKKNVSNILIRKNETPVLKPLEDLKYHEQCGPECLQMLDSDPYDKKFHQCSPLHIPMMCAWRRLQYTLRNFKRRTSARRIITYYAPCGKKLQNLKEIAQYLRETRSLITIDCFSFDLDVDTETYAYTEAKFVKNEDYANKLEGIPIPAVNTVDDEEPPKIEYTKARYAYEDQVDLQTINREFCSGCTCEGDCADSSTCECQQLTAMSYSRLPKALQWPQRAKYQGLYDNRLLMDKTFSGIYECNSQCSCQRKTCHNRVVQNNSKYPMQLFKTAQSGWGVRALTDIPKGAFLCNYVGALLTNDLADKLQNDDQYFADLDLKDSVEKEKMMNDNNEDHDFEDYDEEYTGENDTDDEEVGNFDERTGSEEGVSMNAEDSNLRRSTRTNAMRQREKSRRKAEKERERKKQHAEDRKFTWDEHFQHLALYVVDAKKKGNIGRFLNHSCDPNVQVQHVLYDTHDLRLPWVAFFTTKAVKAGQELCWDYSYTITQDGEEKVRCHCGAEHCRGRLL